MEAGHLRPVGDAPRLAVTDGTVAVGKANAYIAKGASGTVTLWRGSTAASLSATSLTVSAYTRMTYVDSGRWVHLTRFPHGWEIIGKEC
jgi:uncharacterized protein RhaS with RHS repeats